MVTGFARIGPFKCLVVGHHKGALTAEDRLPLRLYLPRGLPQAMQRMEMAAKFNLPIVTLVDTPGAFPGVGPTAATRRKPSR